MLNKDKFENKNLWLFFIITFAFSWILWVPTALASQGFNLSPLLESFLLSPLNPAAFGPLVAAFILTYWKGGRNELIKLLKKGIDYSFAKRWLIPIFFLFPAMTGSALLLAVLSGNPAPNLSVLTNPLMIAIAFVYIFFLGGPLQEEFGWRGYALPRLQVKWNALISSLILGIIWGVWHTPLFFIKGTIQSQTPFWAFMILIISGTILFTWIYNNTNGSILAVMIFHTMNNLSFFIFPTVEAPLGGLYLLFINIIVVVGVVMIWGPKKLVRKKNKSFELDEAIQSHLP